MCCARARSAFQVSGGAWRTPGVHLRRNMFPGGRGGHPGGGVGAGRDDSGGSHDSGSGYDVWARVFNADGTQAVAEFRVNKTFRRGLVPAWKEKIINTRRLLIRLLLI